MSEPEVQVERPADARAFLDVAGAFLGEREAENNLLFGIAANLVRDPDRAMTAPPYFAVVRRGGAVVAAALMTPPFNVVLSWTSDPDAVVATADDLGRSGSPVPGITAPVEVARIFVEHWAAPHGLTPRRTVAERIYRVERVTAPRGVAGGVRIAGPGDRDVLADWMDRFLREVHDDSFPGEAAALVDSGLRTGTRTFHLWEVGGRPVSVAGITGPTPNGIRLGPVYTPPRDRGHGFASAVTAAASQAELDAGRRFVFLFTDLTNPTSNRIYQAIGYEPVIDVDVWSFEPV
jgi:predicted GNAT family acetyltransferase